MAEHTETGLSGPAGAAFSAWLDAFNADPATLKAFASERASVQNARAWVANQRRSGPAKLIRTEAVAGDSVTAVIEDRWGGRWRLQMTVDPAPPHAITALTPTPVWPPENGPPERMSWPQLREALEAKLARDVAKGWFSGAVLVSRAGHPLFSAAHGHADGEQQLANTLDTRFRMGSMNKMMTGVAALQLVQKGVIGLDDPVSRHLPDYPSRPFAEKVRVRHLLNHTGGAGDFFGPEFTKHRLELLDPADYVALFGGRDPEFEPGDQHRYANYGFILMGRIIEVATGQRYDDYVTANILARSGMTATGALPESADVPGRAVGYMDGPDGQVRNDPTLPLRGTPAGGGYSTVGDLVRFADALTSGKLLDAQHYDLIDKAAVEAWPGVKYGMGFQTQSRDGVRSFGHGGGAPGQNGLLLIFPDSGYVVATLSNGDPPQASSLGEFIGQRLPVR
jgi:D-alanyl-D-alanine carboxypeptidase